MNMARVGIDFDAVELLQETSEAAGWRCEYRQLASGVLRSRVELAEYDSLALIREYGSQPVEVVGEPPDGTLAAIVLLPGSRMWINGARVAGPSLCLLWPHEELHAVSEQNTEAVSVHVSAGAAAETAMRISPNGWGGDRGRGFRPLPDSTEVRDLQSLMLESLNVPTMVFARAETDASLTLALARAMVGDENASAPHPRKRRAEQLLALRRARAFIEDHLREPIRLVDVCDSANTSLSTLERLFKRELGFLPLAYIRARRLHAVRCALSNKESAERTVAEIAISYGFNHLGRFSAAFHQQFGRFPSEARIQ
jgi:AraC-like DNA-binding protein